MSSNETLSIASDVPVCRLRSLNEHSLSDGGEWVVYWMTAFRRTKFNFAMQYARDLARASGRPLVILEALRVRYRWASDRMHRFIIEGMRDNQIACREAGVQHYCYVEPRPGVGSGLIKRMADSAVAVVTDDYPCFFHPRMLKSVKDQLSCPLVAVDSNCLMPLDVPDRTFTVAHSYRRYMQKELPNHLHELPDENPLAAKFIDGIPQLEDLPDPILQEWPRADIAALLSEGGLKHIPIDHSVAAGVIEGGAVNATKLLEKFIERRLGDYDEARNEPDEYGSSELSPHLHFGHLSAHEFFQRVMQKEGWSPGAIQKVNGKVNGFWGVGSNAEALLDQLCTWREIGFNKTWREPETYHRFDSLPEWAQETLANHQSDNRPYVYSLEQFENAQTHDQIWNAAQRQLVREGRIHNYMRMLWGKKILHWSSSPRDALKIMEHLNNKYALDGRDPNSYSGIFWVLGRYDRAWGPEREIFGKVRYMTSENTAKKHRLKEYLKRYAAQPMLFED